VPKTNPTHSATSASPALTRARRLVAGGRLPKNLAATVKARQPRKLCDECFAYGPGLGCEANCFAGVSHV
jgi:hypothetical protein